MQRKDSIEGIDIICMNRHTPIPQQLDNLQLLVWDMVCNQASTSTTIIVSSVVSDVEVLPAKKVG